MTVLDTIIAHKRDEVAARRAALGDAELAARIAAAHAPRGFRAALDADLRRHGLPDAAYIAGDTPVFERLAVHAGRFNRAILYRSNTLHCADLPPDLSFDPDPVTGRLTVNTFLDATG